MKSIRLCRTECMCICMCVYVCVCVCVWAYALVYTCECEFMCLREAHPYYMSLLT